MRVCSSLNLHYHSKENISEYIKAGLDFHKENGFDAANELILYMNENTL